MPVFRRQRSAEEDRLERRQQKEAAVREHLSRTALPQDDLHDDTTSTPLNQTFPLAGHLESGHRALRSFIKNKKTTSGSRRRYSATASSLASSLASSIASSLASSASSELSSDASRLASGHATVLERPRRTHPDGGEAALSVVELGVLGTLASPGGFSNNFSPELQLEEHDEQPYLDMTSGPGMPAHTSTPKATPTPGQRVLTSTSKVTPLTTPLATHLAPATNSATPTRRGAGPAGRRHYDKKAARPVNLLSDFDT